MAPTKSVEFAEPHPEVEKKEEKKVPEEFVEKEEDDEIEEDEEDFSDMYENDIKIWALLHRKLARLLSQRLRATSGRLLDALSH